MNKSTVILEQTKRSKWSLLILSKHFIIIFFVLVFIIFWEYFFLFLLLCWTFSSHMPPPTHTFFPWSLRQQHTYTFFFCSFLFCFLEGKINVIKLTTSFQDFSFFSTQLAIHESFFSGLGRALFFSCDCNFL